MASFLALCTFAQGNSQAQDILTFDFAALAGNEATASSNFNNAGLSSSTISRGAGLTASANGGRFNATGWAVSSIANAVAGNNYMEFTITPTPGQRFTVSTLVVQWQRSATGNVQIALRSSLDGYAADIDGVKNVVDNTSTQSFTWTVNQSAQNAPVTYRFYSFAEGTSGSGGPGDGTGNDIVVSGIVEPDNPDSPVISSFSPSAGATGASIAINGSKFTGATSIRFGGVPSTSFAVASDALINAVVPAGAVSGRITVTTSVGTGTSSTDFIALDGGGTVALQNGGAGSFSGKNLFGRNLTGQTVRFVYTPPSAGTVEGLRLTVPAEFGLPLSANVSVSGTGSAGAVVGVSGSIVTVSGLSAISPTTINVDVGGLSTPDTATPITNIGRYAFVVDSRGSGGTFAPLASQPSASVLIPLANARNADPTTFVPVLLNQLVAVEGVCLAGRLGSGSTSSMLQDGNLGIAIYSLSSVPGPQTRGNRYAAVGVIAQFNGVVQINMSDPNLLIDLGASTEPSPTTVSVAEFNSNGVAYQSRVTRIENLSYVSGTWAANNNVVLQDGSANQVTIRIQSNSAATTPPTYPVTITGIGGQFDNASPFDTGFQLQPRDPADLSSASSPAINVSTNALGGFNALRGTPSAPSNLTVTGTNLSGSNIAVTSSNNFYEISTNSFATAGSNALTLASTGGVVAVRISTNAPATNSLVGNLALSGGGATNNVALSGVVTNPPAVITVSTNSLPAFSSTTNVASAAQSFTAGGSALTANITVAAPTGFQVAFTSNNADFGTTVTLTNSGGTATNREVFVRMSSSPTTNNLTARNVTLTTTGGSNQVSVSGTITTAAPSLTATPPSLTNFFAVAGTPSTATNYTLSGSNLSANVTVSAPLGFQVALTNTNSAFTNTLSLTNNGSVSNSIWVRVAANAATNTNLTGNITNTAGAAVTNVALQARVVPAPTLSAVPIALSNFTTSTGIASTNQSFNLTASNLLGPVTMTVTNGYEVSLSPSNGFSTSLSVGLVSASDNASNYSSPGRTNTAIVYVGSESGSAVANWSDPNVAKTFGTSGSKVYGTAGYYQIRPSPNAAPTDVNQGALADNDLGITAGLNPTLNSKPTFATSVTGGVGTFVNFGPYPVFRGPDGTSLYRQGALSVSVNGGPNNSPAGNNASYFGAPLQFTAGSSGVFRLGLVVDAVSDGRYAPDYVSLFSSSTGTVFSSTLVRDGTPDMVFFDVTAKAGDTFTVGLWQNTGTQVAAALSMATFDNLPGWTNGANGGTGFAPWNLNSNNGSGFAGAFLGNPADAGITGMSTDSFGLFANPTGSGSFANAERGLSRALAVGQTLSFQWGINFDSGGGNKGFGLAAGGAEIINVNNGGSATITLNGSDVGFGYGTNVMTWAFTRTASNALTITANDRDGSGTYSTNLVVSNAAIDAVKFYASAMQAGPQAQPYFNNLQIAYADGTINNLPVYVRIAASNAATNSLLGGILVTSPEATNSPSISLSGDVKAVPTITTSNSFSTFVGVSGRASDPPQQLAVVAANLTNPLTVTLPPFFQVSTNGAGGPFVGSPLILSNTNVTGGLSNSLWLRLGSNAPTTTGAVATNLSLSSGTAVTNLAVSYVVNSTNPTLAVSPTNLSLVSTQGLPASANLSIFGSSLPAGLTISATAPFQVSTNSAGPFTGSTSTPLSGANSQVSTSLFVQVATNSTPGLYTGAVTSVSGTNTASVSVVASVIASGGQPQIFVSTNALSGFSTVQTLPSANQTFFAAGYNLTNSAAALAVSGVDYEISTNGTNFTNNLSLPVSGGQFGPATVYVRLSANAVVGTNITGSVGIIAGSASNSVSLSGKVDPLLPPSVTLFSPSNNPTIIAPGSSIRLVATVTDTNVAGGPGTLTTFQFLTNGVPIPGAVTNNVLSPATLEFDWTPGSTLPAQVTASAVDTDGLTGTSSAVTVRYPFEGEPVVGFSPPSANGTVQALAASAGGAFYIGGEFTELNAQPAARVARVLADGEVDPEFNAGTGPNGTVRALLELDGGLLVGGSFSIVDGVARAGLAKLSLAGRIDTAFDAAFAAGAKVNVVVPQYDGQLLVGGQFTASVTTEEGQNGQSVTRTLSNLVRLNPETGAIDPDFRPNPNGEVNAVAVQPDGKILVGGSFGTIAASSRTRLARLHLENPDPNDPTALLDATFVTGSGPSGPVQSIAVLSDGSIVVGGQFATYSGSGNYLNLLKLGPSGTLDPVFNFSGRPQQPATGGFNGAVFDVHVRPSGQVLASGAFTRVENRSLQIPFNEPAGRVVQLRPDGFYDPSFNPGGAGANNTVLRSATLANGNLVLAGAFDRFNDKEVQRIVVLAGANGLDPMVVSAPFLTVPAGQEFAFNFRSSTGAGARFELEGDEPLPVGMSFDRDGLLTGLPLQAGGLRFRVTPSAGGRQGLASDFELYVLPRMVPFSVWQKVWYPGQEDEPDVAGPDVSSGNPSGLSNFMIYALSGGDPRQSGAGILPVAVPTPEPDDGPVYLTLYSPFYPLAEAGFLIEYSDDLRGDWIGVPTSVDPDLGILSGRAPQPMEGSARQFLRLQVAPLPTNQ